MLQRDAVRPVDLFGRLLLIAGLVLAGFLIVRSAIVTIVTPVDPATALRISPGSGGALEKLALLQAGNGDDAEAAAMPAAHAALQVRPIASVPFYVAALAAEQAGDTLRALALMNAVIRRDPRNLAARNWLFDYHLKQEDIPSALPHVDAIMRLRPVISFEMTRAITPLLATPRAPEAFADLLARNPNWGSTFVDVASRTDPVARPFYRMMGLLSGRAGYRLREDLLPLMVSLALGRGDTADARTLYARFARIDAGDSGPFATFASHRPAPFGWTLTSDRSGYAERRDQGEGRDLFVEVHDDAPAGRFASQTLTLAPGRYGLGVNLVSDGAAVSGALQWRVSCARSNGELLRLVQPMAAPGTVNLQGGFTVAADCPVQTLSLEYDPALSAEPGSVQYRDLRVFALKRAPVSRGDRS